MRFLGAVAVLLIGLRATSGEEKKLDFYGAATVYGSSANTAKLSKPASLVLHDAVRREILISRAQVDSMQAKWKQGRAEAKAKGEPTMGPEAMIKIQQREDEVVAAVLTPVQKDLLTGIAIQVDGPYALFRKDVADALSLSQEQRHALEAAIYHRKDGQRLPGTAVRTTRRQAAAEASKILTEQQKADFEKLKGKKVSFDINKEFYPADDPG